MITRISQAEVYSPAALGVQQLLVAGNRIAGLAQQLDIQGAEVFELEASGCLLVPGFVDSLAHIIGGGGEGGFTTRTSEMQFADAARAGVTTLVGVLGTDAVTRTLTNLLAKASAFNELGVTCYCYTGSYQIPARTLMADVMEDLVLIDKFIGVGEVAIADHRSSQPTADELKKLASQARVGGMLAGKAGIVSVHVGSGASLLDPLHQAVNGTELSLRQFYPTHINRNQDVFAAGIRFAKAGGVIDFTTSTTAYDLKHGEVAAAQALALALEQQIPIANLTLSSDGNASLPLFNPQGELLGLEVGKVSSLYQSARTAVLDYQVSLSNAIAAISASPAAVLGLKHKGELAVGKAADLVLIHKDDLQIHSVYAKGRTMVQQQKALVFGTFENPPR